VLIPAQRDFDLYPGGTFDPLLEFYTDRAQTLLFDLTDYSAVMRIGAKWQDTQLPGVDALLELTDADGGLILGGRGGTVQVLITAEQTTALLNNQQGWRTHRGDQDDVLMRLPWFLQWTSPPPASKPDYPVAGTLAVITP
jgi:hypothetical protein